MSFLDVALFNWPKLTILNTLSSVLKEWPLHQASWGSPAWGRWETQCRSASLTASATLSSILTPHHDWPPQTVLPQRPDLPARFLTSSWCVQFLVLFLECCRKSFCKYQIPSRLAFSLQMLYTSVGLSSGGEGKALQRPLLAMSGCYLCQLTWPSHK